MVTRRYPPPAGEPNETVLIVHPDVAGKITNRDTDEQVREIESLTRAIDLDLSTTIIAKVTRIQPGHFLGKGKLEEIGLVIEETEPSIVVFNYTLSPVQQRNLEKAWQCKVIDRTGLILEIFGARAQTKEGRLQVELAAQEYQKSRLVRSWTHLERQRGGAGFMGGPGETQIELDRRIISERIGKLKSELEHVRKTRELGRKSRERVPLPVVALVGYTNAGKSTLFNNLTGADVFAKDLLFATLDPTLRRIELPNGAQAILSDTVGFISDLPTHLIAAFRATLEETLHADVLLHVIDCSRDDFAAQRQDVIDILESLDIKYDQDERIIEVYNKIDALEAEEKADLLRDLHFSGQKVAISALSSEGKDDLYAKVSEILSRTHHHLVFEIGYSDGKALAWLHEHADVISRKEGADNIEIHVTMAPQDTARFSSRFGYLPKEE